MLLSSNRKYPPFPLLPYLSVVVCLRCLLHHILSIYCIYVPGKPRICFYYYCAVYDECKYSDTLWLVDHTRLFVQYTISLSSLSKLIWRHWTYEMPVRYILSSVWVRLSILSQLSIVQYVGLCVFRLPISLVMIEIIYILCLIIIIKSEVWTITHCFGFGHQTMVCAVCLSIFLWQICSSSFDLSQPRIALCYIRHTFLVTKGMWCKFPSPLVRFWFLWLSSQTCSASPTLLAGYRQGWGCSLSVQSFSNWSTRRHVFPPRSAALTWSTSKPTLLSSPSSGLDVHLVQVES